MSFGKKSRVGCFLVLTIIIVLLVMGRPPATWYQVKTGMNRSVVYSLLGNPYALRESTFGGVWWRKELFVGRWEFAVYFREDNTVYFTHTNWKWNW
jgi:hypothetical protein